MYDTLHGGLLLLCDKRVKYNYSRIATILTLGIHLVMPYHGPSIHVQVIR